MKRKNILKKAIVGAGLAVLPFVAAYSQNTRGITTENSYYNTQVFNKDSSKIKSELEDMAEFSIDPQNQANISKTIDDYGDFKIVKTGEYPNEQITIFYEEKLVGRYDTNGKDFRSNESIPQPLFDLYTGVTEMRKQLECAQAQNQPLLDSIAKLNEQLADAKNWRRVFTLEPGAGFDAGRQGLTNELGQPLIHGRAQLMATLGGKDWAVRPAAYISFPLLGTKTTDKDVYTYTDRHDSPSGRHYVLTEREVNSQTQSKRTPTIGGGLRIHPSAKSDFHIDLLVGYAPWKYSMQSTTQERDLSKEVYNADGFFLGDENASLQTYDAESHSDVFDNIEFKAGIGKGRGAIYAVYGQMRTQGNNKMDYVGVASHFKLGWGKGNK